MVDPLATLLNLRNYSPFANCRGDDTYAQVSDCCKCPLLAELGRQCTGRIADEEIFSAIAREIM
jgi:hypothetical protein